MVQIVHDVLLLIFTELQDYPATLYSCALVNSSWCSVAVNILWKFVLNDLSDYKQETREKIYNVIAHFLPDGPEDPLPINNILLPSIKFPRRPTFEYIEYFNRISQCWIRDMVRLSIDEESTQKKYILEKEIYKLVFSRCINVRNFSWYYTEKLYNYPNAKSFFSNLYTLEISLEHNVVASQILPELSNICYNIINLEIHYCKEDSPNLVTFIDIQNNLQSLRLYFSDDDYEDDEYENNGSDEEENQFTLLNEVITKKAKKLKQVTLSPIMTLINPESISGLINIQALELNNENYDETCEDIDWYKWEKCLGKASFPHLEYLETSFLPNNIESLILEKSGGNVLEIDIRYPLEFQDYQTENKQIIRAICNHCPKLRRLTLDIDPRNLDEFNGILSNCTQLEKLYLATKKFIIPNGDELLKIMVNGSPATLREFLFDDNWNFSLEGLESFLISWKCKDRFPIKFKHYFDKMLISWTDNHENILEKYKRNGTII
ncbi:hypothetical protein RclHR1_06980004 [Rhizophagus clarus]|uniref:F-box domain-containing protein n=1 Tax=Rhizophagus clarus TaxID=94130 RepID=A0A2Z6SAE5_9GLOM|nr:hypothetical protein RclHR1_06980004 [Rhizophagus clarus]